jgi:hypothetical protein
VGIVHASASLRRERTKATARTRRVYPSKEALDGAIAGMEVGMPEMFEQLDELLATLGVSVRRS